ncbi:MAG: magnesium transporter [Dehalococcoidales bacterium]|nr:magnesium transporter [Dehalococcoidales bacterium]
MTFLNEDELKELLENKQYKTLRQALIESEPSDIARILADEPTDRALIAFRLLPKDLAVEVFDRLDGALQNRLLESFSDQAARSFLEAMPPDDRVELLDEVPAVVARRLIQSLSPNERRLTTQLLGYEEDSAGREMNPSFIDLHTEMTVSQALARIRRLAINRETIYECYVMDRRRRLIGTVSLRDLVTTDPDTPLSDVMKPNPDFVFTYTDREEVAKVLREHNLLAVPVVDNEQRLVGIITHDDVADILEQEATEDVYRFGAVPGTERGYFASRILNVVKRRVVWLFLLILVNTVTGSVIASQNVLLGEVVILAAFIPLLIGTGGNVGSQSATVVIRGLATGEVSQKRAFSIVSREASVGLLLGVILGLVALGWSYLIGRDLQVAFVVTLTLVAVSTLATITGSILPFVFRLMKIDPAMVSAPLITTVMDIFGVLLYFFIANLLLQL